MHEAYANTQVFRLGETINEPPPSSSSNIILQSATASTLSRRNSSENRVFRMLRAPKSQIALKQKYLKQQEEEEQKRSSATIPKENEARKNVEEDTNMSDMLSSMVDSYLRVSGSQIKEPTRKRRHLTTPGQVPEGLQTGDEDGQADDMEVDEYVYDVYYRESQQSKHQHEHNGLVGLM